MRMGGMDLRKLLPPPPCPLRLGPAQPSPARLGTAPRKVEFRRAGCASKAGRAVGGGIKGAVTACRHWEGIDRDCW